MSDQITIPALLKKGGYSLENDLLPILNGRVFLPNFKELQLEMGIGVIAAGAGLVPYPEAGGVALAQIPEVAPPAAWARYFLSKTQSGALDGTGYVIWCDRSGKGRVGHFAICAHSKVAGAGANRSRGWYPGYCEKCGLNMSVDSGD